MKILAKRRASMPEREKMKIILATFVVAISLLTGCATQPQPNQVLATINSNPPGATISGRDFSGISPQRRLYTLQPGQSRAQSDAISVTWVSGASTTTKLNLIAGQTSTYVIQRPNVPGANADIQWAINLQNQQNSNDEQMGDAANSIGYSLGQILGTAIGKH